MDTLELDAIGYELRPPANLAPMPYWPGPSTAIKLAVAGWPLFVVGLDCADRSAIVLEYLPEFTPDVPPSVYQALNSGVCPLLSVYCIDNGVGVKLVNGIATRVRENYCERYLREIHKLLGTDRPTGVIAAGLNVTDTIRRYFWKVEA